jgi:YtkA-like
MRLATLGVLVALLVPASASAGGFATVGLDPLPDGARAGQPWVVDLTVLQHGRTPLEGVHPRVLVTRGSQREAFPARATATAGVYRAEVVFPTAGTWEYEVDDGFTQTHTFPPVRVGSQSPGYAFLGSALDFVFASF